LVVGGIAVGLLAGPEILTGLAIYGVVDAIFDVGGTIDKINNNKEIKIFDK